jgi:ribosomal protein S9
METTITNIMKRRKAIAAWIIINSNGTISVQQRSFENAKFGYQYHAGTDTVNQNAPGFHIRFF